MLDFSSLKRPQISPRRLMIFSLLYILVVDNFKFWSILIDTLDMSLFTHMFFVAAFFILLFTLTLFLLLFVSHRRLLKPVLVVTLILSAVVSYFMDTYGTVISVSMLHNIAETDYSEATDLLTSGMFFHVFIFGMLPAILVAWVKVEHKSLPAELASRFVLASVCLVISATAVFASYKDFTFVVREHRELRLFINPLYPVTSVYKFAKGSVISDKRSLNPIFSDAQRNRLKKKNTILVMVVGETARASEFHLNGYQRNTTPLIEKNATHIINFNNAYSCGTATAESLPCMFSVLDHDHFTKDEAKVTENLLDGLLHAGIDVLWKENDGSCKGVCQRVDTHIVSISEDAMHCNNEECFDEVLLSGLDKRLDNIKNDTVIVLHQKGSHGPAYYKRYPNKFEVYKPACKTKAVQDCTQDEITNAYDNTILYTDYVLSEVIDLLKHKSDRLDTAMLYMSDHGESLGENGMYLHGLPYFMAPDEQIHVPLIMWLSDEFSDSKKIDMACLRKQGREEKYSHDNLVHTVLGVMDIKTSQYDAQKNIFSPCRIESKQMDIAKLAGKIEHKI